MAGAIMPEVLKRYQPGRLTEKSLMLKNLTVHTAGTSAKDGVEKLRSWSRQVFRAGWPGSAEECFGLYLLRNHKQSSEAKFGQRQKNLDINADQSTSCRQKWRLLLYKS